MDLIVEPLNFRTMLRLPGSRLLQRTTSQICINHSTTRFDAAWFRLATPHQHSLRHYSPSASTFLKDLSQSDSSNSTVVLQSTDHPDNVPKLSGAKVSTERRKWVTTLVRWTKEEDDSLFEHVLQGTFPVDVPRLYPLRTYNSVAIRMSRLRKEYLKYGKLLNVTERDIKQEKDQDMSVVSESLIPPKLARRTKWSKEEDLLLEQLVEKYQSRNMEVPWKELSDTLCYRNEGRYERTPTSCERRWFMLDPARHRALGFWEPDEIQRMLMAIGKQIGDEFRLEIVILQKDVVSDKKDGKKPLLLDGPELKIVNWVKVAEAVGTRSDVQCRSRFFKNHVAVQHGYWSTEEEQKLKEGLAKFGPQWHEIAKHIGTRSPYQVQKKYTDARSTELRQHEHQRY
ncbi:hypothetical protein BG004_006710 [Podila humilis]|nr:hypothetical protein BG004_006710 [Podila humilis]